MALQEYNQQELNRTITSVDPALQKATPRLQMIKDFLEGEDCVKDKEDTYLVKAYASQDVDDYRYLLELATFSDILKRTVDEMVGRVFRSAPKLSCGLSDETLANLGGKDIGAEMLARRVFWEVLTSGRCGLMIANDEDVEDGVCLKVVETLDMTQWAPDGVSWCVVHDSFRKATAEDAGDDIGKLLNPPVFDRYTLYSVEDGKTRARPFVKRKDQSPQSSEGIIDSAQYAQGKDKFIDNLDALPIIPINVNGVDWTPDLLPLYGIARQVQRLYRDESCIEYAIARRIPCVAAIRGAIAPTRAGEDSSSTAKALNVDRVLSLNASDGEVSMEEFTGDILEHMHKAVDTVSARLVASGAAISETKAVEAAETNRLRVINQIAKLQPVIKGTEDGFRAALMRYMGVINKGRLNGEEVEFTLSRNLIDEKLKPDEVASVLEVYRETGDAQTLVGQLAEGEILPLGTDQDALIAAIENRRARQPQQPPDAG